MFGCTYCNRIYIQNVLGMTGKEIQMINRRTFTIFGNEIERQISYDVTKPKVLYEEAQNPSNYFTLNDRIMSRHILMLGGAGSGKTNVFNLTVSQLRDDDNDSLYGPLYGARRSRCRIC